MSTLFDPIRIAKLMAEVLELSDDYQRIRWDGRPDRVEQVGIDLEIRMDEFLSALRDALREYGL